MADFAFAVVTMSSHSGFGRAVSAVMISIWSPLLICVVIGAITTNLYKRFRDLHPDGFLMHIAYHYGFGFSRSASMINPFIKNLLP